MVLRLFGATIGKGSKINASTKIWAPWNLQTGKYVSIGAKAIIYNPAQITLESKCVISQYSFLCTASHDITAADNHLITAPITINSFAWIGARAFVGMGVTVGEGAVIGACAAVFKDVEPWTVVGGNPAMFIKNRVINDA